MKKVFGSAVTFANTEGYDGDGCIIRYRRIFSLDIDITKTHIKAIDQPSKRCSQENKDIDTSACIARFVEEQLGCNAMILGSQYSEAAQCTTDSELKKLVNLSKLLNEADENDIYEMTGCLSSCEKDQYSLSTKGTKVVWDQMIKNALPCQLHLRFRMLDSSYKEEEQYIIYDSASFIADIGGYMGLLLGSSLLSLYMAMEACLRRAVNKKPTTVHQA